MKIVDMFGNLIEIGSRVIYTTNSRDSGLTHGRVEDIYKGTGSSNLIKVKIRPVKDDGSDAYQIEYHYDGDWTTRRKVETHRLQRASTIDYAAHKILVLE